MKLLLQVIFGIGLLVGVLPPHQVEGQVEHKWVSVFEGRGGYRFFVDQVRIETPCEHTRRCWVKVERQDGSRLEAFVEFLEAGQYRTLGERAFSANGKVTEDRTPEIEANKKNQPFRNIERGTSNEAILKFLFSSSQPKGPL